MRLYKLFIAISLMLVAASGVSAYADPPAELRPVLSAYMFEYGSSHLADTYLTPLHYRGSHYGFTYQRDQAMRFNPKNFTMQLRVQTLFDITHNPARNADMANIAISGQWAMMRRWSLNSHLTLAAGGALGLDCGVYYLSRNGNNPASAKGALTVSATGVVRYSGRIWRVPYTISYQPVMPLTGVFFSPDYGQLYYQIYLGETGGLAHAAWPGNYFMLDNLVALDLHLGATSLRLGYRGSIFSSKVNNIVTNAIDHALVIGVTTEWISLSRDNSRLRTANLINPY